MKFGYRKKCDIFIAIYDILGEKVNSWYILLTRRVKKVMKKWIKKIMNNKSVLNTLMVVSCLTAVMAKDGFCFFIYHQPKFPDALKDNE